MDAKRVSATALLRFRQSAGGSGVSRTGQIRPGGKLVVDYDAARLPAETGVPGAPIDIVSHVRFLPGGQTYDSSAIDAGAGAGAGAGASSSGGVRQTEFEVLVPDDATSVELWFESRGPHGTVGWDSRYGANYAFVVTGEGLPVPEPSVVLRPTALVDPARIRVVEDAATKETARIGNSGRRVQTGLVIRALIKNPTAALEAWADIHVFDGSEELIQTGKVVLEQRELTADGALFEWQDVIYQGSGGGSGMGVWSRPDAHTIQYRVYGQAQAQVQPSSGSETQPQIFTDAILHEFEVPSDRDAGAP